MLAAELQQAVRQDRGRVSAELAFRHQAVDQLLLLLIDPHRHSHQVSYSPAKSQLTVSSIVMRMVTSSVERYSARTGLRSWRAVT